MRELIPVTVRSGVSELRDRMWRLFSDWLPEVFTEERSEPALSPGAFWRMMSGPAVDILDREDEVIVKAELPGLDKGDFTVEVESDRLILKGEKKAEREEKQGECLVRESRYGSFYRAIALPAAVEKDKAEAVYKHGVLTVTLPKTAEAKSKRISVKVS